MDAAGKDGAIRSVLSCLSPQGVTETSFKQPSREELGHDYLWRAFKALPEKGEIAIFNRSYYEDVLISDVHKLYIQQSMADRINKKDIISQRYKQIKDFEHYLYENSIRVVKIFLNVSKEEQAERFISRIDEERKTWKASISDIEERKYWDEYQKAFENTIKHTSSKEAPWYVVPADHKWYARYAISEIILSTLNEMNPQFPEVSQNDKEYLEEVRKDLMNSLPKKRKTKLAEKLNPNKLQEESVTENIKSQPSETISIENIETEDKTNYEELPV